MEIPKDKVAVLGGKPRFGKWCVWTRLLAALVQHWLLIVVLGRAPRRLSKVCEAARKFAARLAVALDCRITLQTVIAELCKTVAKTCKRNKRTKAGTFELLNDVSLLDFSLT